MANHHDPGQPANRCIHWTTMISMALLRLALPGPARPEPDRVPAPNGTLAKD